jgi:hypothetical protein
MNKPSRYPTAARADLPCLFVQATLLPSVAPVFSQSSTGTIQGLVTRSDQGRRGGRNRRYMAVWVKAV